jgi:hypothetical protein
VLEEQMGPVTSTLWLPYQMLPDSAHPAPSNRDIGLSQESVVFQFATKFRPTSFAFNHEAEFRKKDNSGWSYKIDAP